VAIAYGATWLINQLSLLAAFEVGIMTFFTLLCGVIEIDVLFRPQLTRESFSSRDEITYFVEKVEHCLVNSDRGI